MNKTILLIACGASILTVGMFAPMATQDASAAKGGGQGSNWEDTSNPCTTEDGDPGTEWRRTDGNPKHPIECR